MIICNYLKGRARMKMRMGKTEWDSERNPPPTIFVPKRLQQSGMNRSKTGSLKLSLVLQHR